MYNATDYYFLYSPVDQRRDDVIVHAGLAFLIVIMSRQLRHVNIVETKQKGRYFSFFCGKTGLDSLTILAFTVVEIQKR